MARCLVSEFLESRLRARGFVAWGRWEGHRPRKGQHPRATADVSSVATPGAGKPVRVALVRRGGPCWWWGDVVLGVLDGGLASAGAPPCPSRPRWAPWASWSPGPCFCAILGTPTCRFLQARPTSCLEDALGGRAPLGVPGKS